MPITELYSKRQKLINGTQLDIYTYNELPEKLKEQFTYIIEEAIGENVYNHINATNECYKEIVDTFTREHGLTRSDTNTNFQINLFYILRHFSVEHVLDIIELTFKMISNLPYRKDYLNRVILKLSANDAINELNHRFKENGVGYNFVSGQIIRIDSTITHENIIKPVLALLWNSKFHGANKEYLSALSHYKDGNNEESINECLKSLESTIKIICHEKGWSFPDNATANKLINTCYENHLIPTYLQNQFTSLRSLLESGVPTIRNKAAGHGKGIENKIADDELTRYALNLAGSSIIFLIELSQIK